MYCHNYCWCRRYPLKNLRRNIFCSKEFFFSFLRNGNVLPFVSFNFPLLLPVTLRTTHLTTLFTSPTLFFRSPSLTLFCPTSSSLSCTHTFSHPCVFSTSHQFSLTFLLLLFSYTLSRFMFITFKFNISPSPFSSLSMYLTLTSFSSFSSVCLSL